MKKGVFCMKYIFLDTETSGLDPYEDRICQLSYLITNEELDILDSKNFYFYLSEVDNGASRVHGLTPSVLRELSGGKVFKDFSQEIKKDLKDNTIICHNVDFDLSFLEQEFKRIGVECELYKDCFCTMGVYTDILKLPHPYYYYKFPKLEEVIDYLSISSQKIKDVINRSFGKSNGFHDARYDVACTYLIYKAFVNKEYEEIEKIIATIPKIRIEDIPF